MAYKIANSEIAARIRKASSDMAVAARRNKPELDREARRQSGLAHIENQILLAQYYITDEDRTALAQLLFNVETPGSPEPLLAKKKPVDDAHTTGVILVEWDPENEEEEEE